MSSWYCNGAPCSAIDVESRGLHYGDGVFETIAVRNGSPRLWPLHVARLIRGCDTLGLASPDTEQVLALIERVDMSYGTAKVIVSAKAGQRGYGRASKETDVIVRTFESQPLPGDHFIHGVDIIECTTTLATGSVTAGLKTLNRLEQVLARNEVLAADRFEGLTRDAVGHLICGTMSNLFAVKDGTIITPDLTRCGVDGVMRRLIIESLDALSINVNVCDIDDLRSCQEVFLSNSQFGVLPVRSCGDKVWPVGDVTRKVGQILANNGVQELSQ